MSIIDQKRAELNAKKEALVAELESCNRIYQLQLDLLERIGSDLPKAKEESLLQQHNLSLRLSAYLTKVDDEIKALG